MVSRVLGSVLTNPGNPSGCVYLRKDELEAIAEICRKQKIIVLLSDEIYARLASSLETMYCMSQVFLQRVPS